jgi:hypothetical protein
MRSTDLMARPVTQSRYWGLSTGLATRNSKVAASGASAANSGRPPGAAAGDEQPPADHRRRGEHEAQAGRVLRSATCPPLSFYAPNRYTTVPGQPACRQIMICRRLACRRLVPPFLGRRERRGRSGQGSRLLPARCSARVENRLRIR